MQKQQNHAKSIGIVQRPSPYRSKLSVQDDKDFIEMTMFKHYEWVNPNENNLIVIVK